MTDAKTITVVLNVSGDGDHESPSCAVVALTEDALLRIGQEMQAVATLSATDGDVDALLAWDHRVRWLRDDDHGSLSEALLDGSADGLLDRIQSDTETFEVLSDADQTALWALLDEADLEVRSEVDRRKVRTDEVRWTAWPKHGAGGEWETAALPAKTITELFLRVTAHS